MEGDASSLGREYDSLDKRMTTLRERLWGPAEVSMRASKGKQRSPGIIERLRGEREMGMLEGRMKELREKIQGLIEVGL